MIPNLTSPTAPPTSAAERNLIISLNSSLIFGLAYLLIYLVNQFSTVLTGWVLGIPSSLFTGYYKFNILNSQWQTDQVIFTYAAGPVVCLLIAIMALALFNAVKTQRGLLKVFLLWVYLHGFNAFFGSLVAGTLVKSGFWYTFRWLVFNDAIVWFFTLPFLLALIFIGISSAQNFLLTCDSISLMKFRNRNKMLFLTLFVPFLAGNLLLSLLKYPDLRLYDILQYLTLGLMLLPIYFLTQNDLFTQTVRSPQRTQFSWLFLLAFGLLAAAFRLVLQNGIEIG